ncbi:hypothetical protein [Kribbella sp. NPDC006257]|uniref:hypothetical protein n=1 Tax=Kribbella sp. NPDC006257 TaxID=3156738 RepID=UPI0033BA91CB
MELKPLLVTRIANALVWPVLGVVVVVELISNGARVAVVVVGAGVCLAGAAYLGLLGWRLGVVCEEAALEVHGLFRRRRIPREEIIAITDFPAVRWKAPGGRVRWSPIFAFANPGRVVPFVERHNEAAVAIMQDWQTDARRERPKNKRRQRPAR